MQSAGTELCTIAALDLVCQNRNPCCARANLPNRRRPDNLSTYCDGALFLVLIFFFIWIIPERVERSEENGLSSSFAFSSSGDESWCEDCSDIQRTSSMKQELFPFVWSSDVTHQLRRYRIPPMCFSMTQKYDKVFGEFMQYWNLILSLPA